MGGEMGGDGRGSRQVKSSQGTLSFLPPIAPAKQRWCEVMCSCPNVLPREHVYLPRHPGPGMVRALPREHVYLPRHPGPGMVRVLPREHVYLPYEGGDGRRGEAVAAGANTWRRASRSRATPKSSQVKSSQVTAYLATRISLSGNSNCFLRLSGSATFRSTLYCIICAFIPSCHVIREVGSHGGVRRTASSAPSSGRWVPWGCEEDCIICAYNPSCHVIREVGWSSPAPSCQQRASQQRASQRRASQQRASQQRANQPAAGQPAASKRREGHPEVEGSRARDAQGWWWARRSSRVKTSQVKS
jgi:hypothetical protein